MRNLILGLGVQGAKRLAVAKDDVFATVDPNNEKASFKSLYEVPLDAFDCALVCTPEKEKINLVKYLLKNKKHVLVEKPLFADNHEELSELVDLINENKTICYTAYNHRFEPHFIKMKNLIHSGELGKIYNCRIFYGNGTAKLIKDSDWRDTGSGVLRDLGSHLLDTCRFWFGTKNFTFQKVYEKKFETKAPDHIIIHSSCNQINLQLEMSFCSWRNQFSCDLIAENGSAHIDSLCKWGPSKFTIRQRVFPAGKPVESEKIIRRNDPTWELEYKYFSDLITGKERTTLKNDIWINKTLKDLGEPIVE